MEGCKFDGWVGCGVVVYGVMEKKSCCTPAHEMAKVKGCTEGQKEGDERRVDAKGNAVDEDSTLNLGKGYVSPVPKDPIRFANMGSTEGMVKLDGGVYLMGADDDEVRTEDGETPVREVEVKPFYMDATTVTNEQFSQFISETGYVTEAEKFGWSYVFWIHLPKSKVRKMRAQTVQGLTWWFAMEGAQWRKPIGPGSNIKKLMGDPVVHVTWNDAHEYCKWAGKRLATDAEWEYAARGGLEQKKYAWGDELHPDGKHRCNIWQGGFPKENSAEDGYVGRAPARSFKPNGYGLYNVAGNVWEWIAEWFSATYHLTAPRENPTGPIHGERKTMRGGSYLCHHSYCNRYRVAARTGNTPDSSTDNCGFRCVRDV